MTGFLRGCARKALVNDAIRSLVDRHAWQYQQAIEANERNGLKRVTLSSWDAND